MPNPAHTRGAATATRQIAAHGRVMALVSRAKSGPSYNQVVVEAIVPIMALATQFNKREIDGDTVLATDKRLLVDATVVIDTSMRVRDGDVDYSIVAVEPIQPGDTLIVQKLQVRI